MSTLRFYRILSLVTLRRLIGGFRGGNECEGMGGGKRREGEVRRRGEELSKESRVDERRGEERRGENRKEKKRRKETRGEERSRKGRME